MAGKTWNEENDPKPRTTLTYEWDTKRGKTTRNFIPKFALVIGGTALLATVLHGIEGAIWAAAYRVLGASPDNRFAMLYSLSAMTTYGHANPYLKDQWQLMGAFGSTKRDVALRADDGISVRHDPKGLAARQ